MNDQFPMEPELAELLELAREAARNSYSPYSGFRVGAALKLASGEIVTGTNVENASYGLTICAERAALVRAVAEFGPEIRVAAVAVTNLNGAASPPCGACRQVLAEFILPDAPVAFPAADGVQTMLFSALLPLAFGLRK
ncbi:MAG TPA: cytidine deaminase [Acidobacteriaceae bacterium]|nr:cytidine deaminase [Acidobacteriaceae bacterium]